jgi:Tol biopolymer transport system component
MTGRFWTNSCTLATVAGSLVAYVFAGGGAGVPGAPSCDAGEGLCYDVPVNAGPLINTSNFDGGPALSQDGLTLLFGSARRNSLGQLDEDLYVATRTTTAEPFGPAANLGPSINSHGFGDYSPQLSLDGLTLYFSSSRPGGLGQADLYVTTRESVDAPWGPPQNLGPNVNSSSFEGQPSVSPNGKTLYWDSNRPGFGDFDIWMATRENVGDSFEPAVNAGPEVNTAGPEFGPAISQNAKRLFFSSGRPGNVGLIDIWVVERQTPSDLWGSAINLDTLNAPFFQAMPTFRGNGREVCFMAVRPGGLGGLDIWCANRVR